MGEREHTLPETIKSPLRCSMVGWDEVLNLLMGWLIFKGYVMFVRRGFIWWSFIHESLTFVYCAYITYPRWIPHLSLFDSRVAPVSHRWTSVNMERTGVTRFEELRIATVFAGFGSCRTWAGRKKLCGNASLTSWHCRHLTYVRNVEHTTFMITVNGCRGLSHSQKPIDSEDDVTLTQKKTQLTFGEFHMQITNRSLFLRSATLKWTPMALLKQMLLVNNCRLRTCSMWLEKRGSLASGGLKFCGSLRCCSDVFWPGEIPHGSGGL